MICLTENKRNSKIAVLKVTHELLTQGNVRVGKLMDNLIPGDVVGSSSRKKGKGNNELTLNLSGLNKTIKTDIPKDKKIFRRRGEIKEFARFHDLRIGDELYLEQMNSHVFCLRPSVKHFTVLSLFSGCGGLDLGFSGGFKYRNFSLPKTKFEVNFANDFDPDAIKVLKANTKYFKHTQISDIDVLKINENELPDFDVLLAGFPCQPFSNAGKRQGIHDQNGRGTLFYQCERLIKSRLQNKGMRKPIAFVFENVKGILSSEMPDGRSIPEEIVKRMKKLGFNTQFKLLKAKDYGVPQDRHRVFFIGTREDLPPFDFSILDEVVRKYGLPSAKKDPYELLLGSILSDIPTNAPHLKDYWPYSPTTQKMISLIGPCNDKKEAIEKFKEKIPLEKISVSISSGRSWKNIHPSKMSQRFRKIWDNPKKYRAPNFYRRFALGEICGTITASGQPENSGITHPFLDRRFTIREIARIQTFPDDFAFPHTSISNAYKVIGNAVPPILGWVVAKGLEIYLNEKCNR